MGTDASLWKLNDVQAFYLKPRTPEVLKASCWCGQWDKERVLAEVFPATMNYGIPLGFKMSMQTFLKIFILHGWWAFIKSLLCQSSQSCKLFSCFLYSCGDRCLKHLRKFYKFPESWLQLRMVSYSFWVWSLMTSFPLYCSQYRSPWNNWKEF